MKCVADLIIEIAVSHPPNGAGMIQENQQSSSYMNFVGYIYI